MKSTNKITDVTVNKKDRISELFCLANKLTKGKKMTQKEAFAEARRRLKERDEKKAAKLAERLAKKEAKAAERAAKKAAEKEAKAAERAAKKEAEKAAKEAERLAKKEAKAKEEAAAKSEADKKFSEAVKTTKLVRTPEEKAAHKEKMRLAKLEAQNARLAKRAAGTFKPADLTPMSDASTTVLNDQLTAAMLSGSVKFSYKNKKGEVLVTTGTLMTDRIPTTRKVDGIVVPKSKDMRVFYDVRHGVYRQYDVNNLVEIIVTDLKRGRKKVTDSVSESDSESAGAEATA